MPEDREPNAPDMPHADTRTPLHGPTGGVPSDKALSDSVPVCLCLAPAVPVPVRGAGAPVAGTCGG
eukprot:scaffold23147_cov147-Isochrysis_galbana.AAC.6